MAGGAYNSGLSGSDSLVSLSGYVSSLDLNADGTARYTDGHQVVNLSPVAVTASSDSLDEALLAGGFASTSSWLPGNSGQKTSPEIQRLQVALQDTLPGSSREAELQTQIARLGATGGNLADLSASISARGRLFQQDVAVFGHPLPAMSDNTANLMLEREQAMLVANMEMAAASPFVGVAQTVGYALHGSTEQIYGKSLAAQAAGAILAPFGALAGTVGIRSAGRVEVPNTARLAQTGGGNVEQLADDMYASIRASNADVQSIAESTGFKPANIQKIKDHVFYNEHLLDSYVDLGVPARVGRFDSNLAQAQAWQRLESGAYTSQDITWLKHEIGERWYEQKYSSGYLESHNRVEPRWTGNPWGAD